jgi:chromosome segregation ATPase
VHPIVAYRYTPTMTVPGKGGRPRKWRSDADRVRAFRARHRGEQEPATFEEALVDGDDLARAVEHTRQLQADHVATMAALSESNEALQNERRRQRSTLRRLDRARAELDGLHTAGDRREEELELLREGFAGLRDENAALRARIALTAPGLSLARSRARRTRTRPRAAPRPSQSFEP